MDERPVVLHKGIYKKTATLSQAVFMITGMTIGAGILGLPFAVAQVGLGVGLIYIVVLGLIMLALNLMIGEVALQTKTNLQLPGFAGKYLGKWAKLILSITILSSSFGVLLAYMIGEGVALTAIFGGSPLGWSVIFWSVGNLFIWSGLERISRAEKILSLSVMTIITLLSLFLLPHFNTAELLVFHGQNWLFPIGVILFALHASPAVGEAHALLAGNSSKFRQALLIGTLIPIGIYLLFTTAVVGLSGQNTTEIATVGLGAIFGPRVGLVANIFAILAMCTGFMGLGTALKETLVWDHRVPSWFATFLVAAVPLFLFLFGLRSFISILDVVGGLFIGIEALIMVAVYVVARRRGHVHSSPFMWLYVIPIVIFFLGVTGFSIYQLFVR